jgi:predicted nuclease of restriction endonuclease-like (RecB) superfamily
MVDSCSPIIAALRATSSDESQIRVYGGRSNCCDIVATIELVTLPGPAPHKGSPCEGVLCGDVPNRALGHPNLSGKDRQHAVPTHRTFESSKGAISSAIANLRDGRITPEVVFRDPYLLDFLGLKGAFSERDLENAILREIEGVLLEFGTGFAFVARQKRMSVGEDDFHLDLLFYHRHLQRLIAVELKLESFQPAHVGQMEFYLRWLDTHERAPNEDSPIGLILCASANAEQVELLQLDAKSIRVSEYLTELPPMRLLQTRLHQAIAHAKEQVSRLSERDYTASADVAPRRLGRKQKEAPKKQTTNARKRAPK